MCRLYGFRASEPTKVECSLVHAQNALLRQSRADRRGQTNADGWGIGYYRNASPHIERRTTAAFRDAHFSSTARRVYAVTVVAHVRDATVGGTTLDNTHPFVHGRWLFAHNGTVRAFDLLRPRLLRETGDGFPVHGTTDSEVVFSWLLSRMAAAGLDGGRRGGSPEALAGLLAGAVETLARWGEAAGAGEPARLNFLLTDGRVLAASRWHNTLHWLERIGVTACDICGVPHARHTPGAEYRSVDVASEPLTEEPWQEVPEHSVLSVNGSFHPTALSV